MKTLPHIAQEDPQWSLDDFVDVVNQLLPQFLPEADSDNRVQDTVNPRLVRHYTTQGLLDKPLRQGREARYLYRHLLQLLLLRRLLTEGYSASSLASLMAGKSNAELEGLLQGGAQLTVEAANPALAFLSQIQARQSPPTVSAPEPSMSLQRSMPPPSSPPVRRPSASLVYGLEPSINEHPLPAATSQWTRLEVLDGLELHIREDFAFPTTAHEREQLLQLIAQRLTKPT